MTNRSRPRGAAVLQVAAGGLLRAGCGGSWSIRTVGMSAASASATFAPRKAKLMRARGARLLRTRDRSAPLAVGGTGRADVASAASDAVEAQQRFLAYAAHELRREIALQLTLAEVALADPNADRAALREMGERVVAACERHERLLEALLTLARSGCGRLRREPVDLAATAAEVLRAHDHHGLRSTTALELARTTGDPQLVERLVANLVANAVRHNVPGGRLDNRHVHRRGTRDLHDREHRPADSGRRAHPPLPTVPASHLSPRPVRRWRRARPRDRASDRRRPRRHRHRTSANRRRPRNRRGFPALD
jgi:K+-sensing histidine kinase KdpD